MTSLQEPEIKFASKPTIAITDLKLKSGFSLNEVKNNISKTEIVSPDQEKNDQLKNNTEITFETVKAYILAYAETKQQQGARQLYTTLTTSTIDFTNNLITLTINNETQRELLQNIKQDFLDELRKKLQSNVITLEVAITRSDVKTKAYKPADIFKSMAEKNPSLLELKKRFDLEIDY